MVFIVSNNGCIITKATVILILTPGRDPVAVALPPPPAASSGVNV